MSRQEAISNLQAWRADPVLFVRQVFHVEPDAWQHDALMSQAGPNFRKRRRLVMKACTGPGKTAVLAWIAWWRLVCFGDKGEHPKGYALSITEKNLKANLWPELAKWRARSPMLMGAFEWTKEKVYAKDHPETWFLEARSFAQDADPEAIGNALSGLHSAYPFILLDEIGDMPLAVGQKSEQIFTGAPIDALICAAGNPTSTSGLLYHLCVTLRDQWAVVTITADPDDPKRTPRVDIDLAREQIALYGRDNAWVMATILGLFPSSGFNTLLSLAEVEAAMQRAYEPADYEYQQKRLGVDVAFEGDDCSAIAPRQGLVAYPIVILRNQRGPAIAARVAAAKGKWGSEMEFIDGTGGYGAGVVDAMIPAGLAPVEVQFAGKADDPRYFNKRSEMWFRMADWVKRGGALPNDPTLVRELTTPKYTLQGGKFRLEEKLQIKKRLGFSPDRADALGLTFAFPEMPSRKGAAIMEAARHDVARTQNDHDPLHSPTTNYDPLDPNRM